MTGLAAKGLQAHRGGRLILDCPDLPLGSQGAVALIGPNGAGKSTLLKALAGLDQSCSGQVTLDGREVKSIPARQRARLISYLPQTFKPCWNQSVRELLNLAASRTGAPALAFQTSSRQFKLEPLLARRWDGLSGGERGRVVLAMALAGDPPVLLADEPGAALDIGQRLAMLKTFLSLADKSLVVVCLHDLDLAVRYFDRFVLLHQGRPVYVGPGEGLWSGKILEEAFGVTFSRLKTEDGWLLRTDLRPESADSQVLDRPSFHQERRDLVE